MDGPVGVQRLWELLRDGHFALLTRRDKPQRQIEHAAVTHAVVPEQDVAQWGGADTALVRPDGYFAWLGAREQTATALARWIEGVAAPARGASVN